jgi:hypothetical protein
MGTKPKAKFRGQQQQQPAAKASGAPEASKPSRWATNPVTYLVTSLLILVPCFWQSRIQAGDLSSHIYNTWLAQMAAKGQAPGIAVVPQTTNVLFDLMLSALFEPFGAAVAQRIAVSIAVLVFFWGAFAFIAAVSRRPWSLAPIVAALTYGFVFHMGFFNFYLSLGLCFGGLALAWEGSRQRIAAAIPLFALAYVAHGLPLVWAIGALGYALLWRRLSRRARMYLLGAAIASLVLLRAAIETRMRTFWAPSQVRYISGADQLWVFGDKYLLPALALFAVWLWMAATRWRMRSQAAAEAAPLVGISIVTAAGIFILPIAIWLPGYAHQLAYITQRMSLPLAVAVCCILGSAPVSRSQTAAMAGIALVFFGFLYADDSTLNAFEDQVDALLAQLPPMQRVVLSVREDGLQADAALSHIVDRECIGRCWSIANYEPSTRQFRVRTSGETSAAARTDTEAWALSQGFYVVKPGDLPLFQIVANNAGRLLLRRPPPGAPLGTTGWDGL